MEERLPLAPAPHEEEAPQGRIPNGLGFLRNPRGHHKQREAACSPRRPQRKTLVVAALAACGESRVTGLRHVDRGYCGLEEGLRGLGAEIRRTAFENL